MSLRQTCCVSVDVDSILCYYKIHALGAAPEGLRSRILCQSLPRFAELLAERDIRATFFVVAEDIDISIGADAVEMRAALAEIIGAGHEIASHSYSHPYELARLPSSQVHQELRQAHGVLGDFVGTGPVGFRAPGYEISSTIVEELVAMNYAYDSSIFPAPGYYLAKAAVMAALRVVGRPSGAVLTNPRVLLAPSEPYRPCLEKPWQRGTASIMELPIAVTPRTRTPVIGTNLVMAPGWLRRHWIGAMSKRDFFNFELHAIDLCDAVVDDLPAVLAARQPDLRVSLADKLRIIGQTLDQISASGFRFKTLRDSIKA